MSRPEDLLAPLDLDDELARVPVKIGGKDYELVEASGDAARRYKNAMSRCAQLNPDGKTVMMRDLADVEPVLVEGCLFSKNPGTGRFDVPVTRAFVLGLPSNTVTVLYERAKAISKLGSEAESIESLKKHRDKLSEQIAKLEADKAELGN